MSNPFQIGFGVRPEEYIPLLSQRREVEQAFNETNSQKRAFVLVGVRGSGKTVLLNEIAKRLGNDWIKVDLNSQEDMMKSLTAQLYADESMHKHFLKAKLDFSFMGIGVHIEKSVPAYDYQTAITLMLKAVKKQNKRVLVKIDEVANTQYMRTFASAFQIFIGNDLPIYLLMAGIPDNVKSLTDEAQSTFLIRTPKIEMRPLNTTSIKRSYMRRLNVDESTALSLAHMTKGYAFAYQALGQVCWGKKIVLHDESFEDILYEYDQNLQEYSYYKIWEELSGKDRVAVRALAEETLEQNDKDEGGCQVKSVREAAKMSSSEFSVYRQRLKRKGLLACDAYGKVSFALPRFAEFVRDQ